MKNSNWGLALIIIAPFAIFILLYVLVKVLKHV